MSDKLLIVCPRCAALNRVPAERLAQKPHCGECKSALFDGRPVELTADTFDRHVSRGDLPVVVDFWAPWCGPCKSMAPAYAQAASKLEPRVRLAKLDTDQAPDISARYGIRAIPTLIIFRGGKEIARQAGAMGGADIIRWIQSANL